MVTLLLLRHFKSSWDTPGQDDFARPLAPRGRKAGKLLAAELRRRGFRPGLVLCSAAARTRQTLELIGDDWGGIDTCIERGLYEAPEQSLLARLRRVAEDVSPVLLIGHNPGLGRLADLLDDGGGDAVARRRMAEKFPTGALAVFERGDGDWRSLAKASCRLVEFLRPRDLSPE